MSKEFSKIEIEAKKDNGRARPRRRPQFNVTSSEPLRGRSGATRPSHNLTSPPRRAPRALRSPSPGTSVSRPLTQKQTPPKPDAKNKTPTQKRNRAAGRRTPACGFCLLGAD